MKEENITLRKLKDDINDYKKLEKWYQEEEVYSNFEQRKLSFEEIKNKYQKRTLKNAKVPVYMIEYNNEPIGIIQYKLINEEESELYKIKNDAKNYEIDIFIGELEYHNKGIGKISINILSQKLLEKEETKNLIMCPLKDNYKAIKCYQNCGFKIIREFKTNNTIGEIKDYILMIKSK